MSEDKVWVATYSSTGNSFGIDAVVEYGTDEGDAWMKLWNSNRYGRDIPAEQYLTTLTLAEGKPSRKKPIVCGVGRIELFSPEIVETLSEFDLGAGKFIPVDVYMDKDWKKGDATRLNLDHSFWNTGVVKDSFLPDESQNIVTASNNPKNTLYDKYKTDVYLSDDDLALSRRSLEGPNVWVEENFLNEVFFSDRVVQRLREKNLAQDFKFVSCRVVGA